VCKEDMPVTICGYWGCGENKDLNFHVGCAEKKIDVFKIESVGQGSFYYDTDFPPIDLWDSAEFGDGYKITKEKMSQAKYLCLPEFTGF
jgi:hypothetical protein